MRYYTDSAIRYSTILVLVPLPALCRGAAARIAKRIFGRITLYCTVRMTVANTTCCWCFRVLLVSAACSASRSSGTPTSAAPAQSSRSPAREASRSSRSGVESEAATATEASP